MTILTSKWHHSTLTLFLLLLGLTETYIRGTMTLIANEIIILENYWTFWWSQFLSKLLLSCSKTICSTIWGRWCFILSNHTQTFLFCVSEVKNMVGTASSRSFTHLPVLSMHCSSKWLLHSTEKRVGVQSFHFMLASHFLSLRGLYSGNLL